MIFNVKSRESIAVADTAKTLTASAITTSVIYARIQVQVASVRVTFEGTTPAPATPVGEIWYPGDIYELWGTANMTNFKAIREGSTSAVLEVTYLGQ